MHKLWEHLAKLKMNFVKNMEYIQKHFKNNVTDVFFLFKGFLKNTLSDLKMTILWNFFCICL